MKIDIQNILVLGLFYILIYKLSLFNFILKCFF